MQPDELSPLLEAAKDHFNQGHYKLAEPLLMQLQSEAYPKPDIAYMLAAIAFDRGQLKKAIQLFKQSLEIDPEFTDSAVGLSIILNDLGRYDEAKKVFENAYSVMKGKQKVGKDSNLNQKLARKHAELGELYLVHNMYKEASGEFTKAARLMPEVTEYTLKVGECALKTKDDTQAISAFEKALSNNYEVDTHLKLVEAYNQSGQKDKAHFELDKMQVRNGERPEIASWRQRLDDLNF
jgi:tetratricopeptide (TPR) repeat protein